VSKKTKAPAPDAEAPEGAEAPARKMPPLKVLIAAGVAAVFVLGGGGVGATMLLTKKPAGATSAKAHAKPKKKGGHGEGEKGKDGKSALSEGPNGVVYYTMPDIVANIQTPDGRPSYLKLKLAFELPDAGVADEIEPNAPRLNDMFQSFLRELRPEDLAGSAGSYQLRMEIQRRVNLVIAPARVNSVLIQEMLIN
jgi:flagellar FliL protein